MALPAGTRLGVYEIVAPLGAGGMGEVYRARDTRLDRTVAIKVLAASLAGDPELRERFDREARAISSLNHPHICALYDIGEVASLERPPPGDDTLRFLVLEYLEGQTLAERLEAGPLPPSDALQRAIEISDALDKAHRSGIVHRDLKPANVMLTKAGAKLLDFGLAKRAAPAVVASGLSMLPTTPANLTAQGTILGTFQYMAPEQIEGLEADARTDIFAFGALLFEMLTGRPAFEGKTRASLLGAILKDEPPAVSRVQPVAPAALDRIISTCLAKDPDDRYQSARDLRRELAWVASGSSEGAATAVTARARSHRFAWVAASLSIAALIATGATAWRLSRDVTPASDPVQFTIAPPANMFLGGPPGVGTGVAAQLAVSPDGRHIVFVAGGPSGYQVWLRPLAALAATPMAGTEGATFPFWSPDSRSIGFFADGKLKRVPIAGGPATTLCDAPVGRGGSWNRDNVIVFGSSLAGGAYSPASGGILRVSSAGGAPSVVTAPDPVTGETYRWPHFLPDGRHFIYTAATGACCPAAQPSIVRVGSLDSVDAGMELLQTESAVSYASGHLLYVRDNTLVAQPFDADTRRLQGDAFPVAENASRDGNRYVSASASANGALVYAQGSSTSGLQLTWFDRAGRPLETLGDAAPYTSLTLSPDDLRVAVAMGIGSPENIDIWIIDIARNIPSRLADRPGADRSPVWSPDGTRIAFGSDQPGKSSLRQNVINRAAADEVLWEIAANPARSCELGQCSIWPNDWSADGNFIAYTVGTFTATRVWVLPLFGDRQPFRVSTTEFIESSGQFSPDGRWIAYTSNAAGARNVYVQPFPAGAPIRVSRDGGSSPVWRADGAELFYLDAEATMMAVKIDTAGQSSALPSLGIGVPEALFLTSAPLTNNARLDQMYAVTKDGSRFLISVRARDSAAPLTVVLNWTAAIQR